jgi:nucleotide-binding universal stress UspA family protein
VFKKILVALDRSPQSPVVFDKAIEIAKIQSSNLLLLNCISLETELDPSTFLGVATLGDVNVHGNYPHLRQENLQKEVEQARDWLQTYAQQAEDRNLPVEFDCRVGMPSKWICDRARAWEADLIVVGRRGYSGLSEFFLGSVSNYIVHHAPCSVLIVQGSPSLAEESAAIATTESETDEFSPS